MKDQLKTPSRRDLMRYTLGVLGGAAASQLRPLEALAQVPRHVPSTELNRRFAEIAETDPAKRTVAGINVANELHLKYSQMNQRGLGTGGKVIEKAQGYYLFLGDLGEKPNVTHFDWHNSLTPVDGFTVGNWGLFKLTVVSAASKIETPNGGFVFPIENGLTEFPSANFTKMQILDAISESSEQQAQVRRRERKMPAESARAIAIRKLDKAFEDYSAQNPAVMGSELFQANPDNVLMLNREGTYVVWVDSANGFQINAKLDGFRKLPPLTEGGLTIGHVQVSSNSHVAFNGGRAWMIAAPNK